MSRAMSRSTRLPSSTLAPRRATAIAILVAVGILFAIPIVAMLEFTLRTSPPGGHTFAHWVALFDPANAAKYKIIWVGVGNSVTLALVTVGIVLVLLAPTMLLVQLRFPRLRQSFEFLCLLPISVPAIVTVVGLAPIYQVIGRTFGTGIWSLSFAYGITVLPFAYRAIQSNIEAVDLITLTEAARSLGASWRAVLLRVLVPNLRVGLLSASLIAIAVVFGEYTIASLLGRQNLQTVLVLLSQQDPYISIILALLTLALSTALLLVIGKVASAGSRRTTLQQRSSKA